MRFYVLDGGGPKDSENTLNSILTKCGEKVFWQIGTDMDPNNPHGFPWVKNIARWIVVRCPSDPTSQEFIGWNKRSDSKINQYVASQISHSRVSEMIHKSRKEIECSFKVQLWKAVILYSPVTDRVPPLTIIWGYIARQFN